MNNWKRKYVCEPTRCIVCGFEFTPITRKAMYCSDACKQMAYRKRINEKSYENYETINYLSSSKSESNPEEWMNNYMNSNNKSALLEINDSEFFALPVYVRNFYQESWLTEREFRK